MIMMDPPEHTSNRRLLAPGFTPNKLTSLTQQIHSRATKILDKISDRSECEFVTSVAAELPIQMLAELFGVPQKDRHQLFEWSNIVIGGEDPDISISRKYVINAFMEMAMYAIDLGEQRKKEPGNDLITMLVQPNAEGEMMTTEDYVNTFMLLVVAGNETTRNSISGGVLALSQFPEQRPDPSTKSAVHKMMVYWCRHQVMLLYEQKIVAGTGGYKATNPSITESRARKPCR